MLPLSVDELLQDDRFPKPQRHLRKPYPDPMSGDGSWGVLRQGSRIVGFYSLSDQKPLKKSGFDSRYSEFSAAQSLREWRFMFKEPAAKSAGNSPGIPIATFPKAATSGNPAISSFPFN